MDIIETNPEAVTAAGIASAPVRIEKWVYGGEGLARADGKVVLVPFVLPEELVGLTVTAEKGSFARALPSQILEANPVRIEAPCPVFTRCGGCQYQHAPYDYELERKREIAAEVLGRIGKIQLAALPEVIAAEPWEYRNRAQFHIENGKIGYLAAASNRLVPIDHCPISSPSVNSALKALNKMVRHRRFPGFVQQIEVFTNEQTTLLNVQKTARGQRVAKSFFEWAAEAIPGAQAGELFYTAAGFRFRVSHGSFFQVNRFLIDALVEAAMPPQSPGTALDLYAGVGLFTLPLASRFERVVAIESTRGASSDLTTNAENTGLRNIEVQRGSVEEVLGRPTGPPAFVLADPPRAGLGTATVDHLIRLEPPQLTIVACNVATLARDLAGLLAGGFHLTRVQLVDLFPQTAHIEVIAHLER